MYFCVLTGLYTHLEIAASLVVVFRFSCIFEVAGSWKTTEDSGKIKYTVYLLTLSLTYVISPHLLRCRNWFFRSLLFGRLL